MVNALTRFRSSGKMPDQPAAIADDPVGSPSPQPRSPCQVKIRHDTHIAAPTLRLRGNMRLRVIAGDFEILKSEPIDAVRHTVDHKLWQPPGLRVSCSGAPDRNDWHRDARRQERMHEFTGLQSRKQCDHMGQQRIGGDIETAPLRKISALR